MIATTLPIKLSDVCLELYGSSSTVGRSLSQAFTDATGTFDATYESINGYRNSLQNFRGYKHIFTAIVYVASIPNTTGMINPTNIIGAGNENYMCYDIAGNGFTYWTLQLQSFSIPVGATIIASQLYTKAYSNTSSAIGEEAHTINDSVGTFIAQYGILPTIDARLTTIATSYDTGYSTPTPIALTVAKANAGLILQPGWANRNSITARVCTDYYKYQLWWTV